MALSRTLSFFFFNDTATTEIYTLSLHDALPISATDGSRAERGTLRADRAVPGPGALSSGRPAAVFRSPRQSRDGDRKSTRLNSSHLVISYAVFCLKKKKPSHADQFPRDLAARRH